MTAEGVQISVEGLHYERQKLSALVFDPLQEVKDFLARNLRSKEVDRIVECLRYAIRRDTLKTVTDGEALIAVLNLYYGKDNLRVLERLLKKINCYDLLEILNEWNVANNPVETRVLRECGYFPLWIRINNDFAWFVGNKRRILQGTKSLFRIPEITPGDPDFETLIYMGVSFGKSDLLIYVLAPLCTRNYIHTSLGRNDVRLALEQLSITGIYFARYSEINGFGKDLSAASFTSIDDSMKGDNIEFTDQPNSRITGSNDTPEPNNKHFRSTVLSQTSPEGKRKDLRVVRGSIGYVDPPSSVSNSSPPNRPADPIRVVRPKMIYLQRSKEPSTDMVDSSRILQDKKRVVEQTSQRFSDDALQVEQSKAGNLDETSNYDHRKPTRGRRSFSGENTSSDFELCKGGSKEIGGEASPFHSLPNPDSKKHFISTATFQVNKGNMNGVIKKYDEKERSDQSHFFTGPTQNGNNAFWYEDDTLEDFHKEMIPEPEPGNTQLQFGQNEDFRQVELIPELQAETAKYPKTLNGFGHSPLISPPQGFRNAKPTESKLVKVKTTFVETPLHQPMLLSTNEERNPPRGWESPRLRTQRPQEFNRPTKKLDYEASYRLPDQLSAAYDQNSVEPIFVHRRPFLMKVDTKIESEYEDSVFTDTESHGDMTLSRFATGPPSYLPPPEYNGTSKRSPGKLSDDSAGTDSLDRSYKSTLLSAASVTSICRQKEMFLSREELQMSIRGAEGKEVERQTELCKELMIAAKAGDKEEIERTVDEGVDVDYQNEFGQSALMVASWEGHLGIVEILLNADADPDLQDGFGKSALHEAALGGHHTIVHRLISGGAKIDLTDEEQRTPLHYAAMRGKRRIVEVLLLFGANVSLLTKFAESAVELAYSYHHDDIVDLLMASRDKKIRKEMESQIRKQRLRLLSSTTSLPNLSKVSSMKDLSRSRSRPDLRKKKSVCPIQ